MTHLSSAIESTCRRGGAWSLVAALGLAAGGCGASPQIVPEVVPLAQSPLPPEVVLVASDPGLELLGAVFDWAAPSEPRATGEPVVEPPPHSLLDLGVSLRENPCVEHLQVQRDPGELQVVDVWSPQDRLVAALELWHFAAVTTHLFVRLESDVVASAVETDDYAACCEEADCGAGFVAEVHEGTLQLNPATALTWAMSPLVLVTPDGRTTGFGLHDGVRREGGVAIRLSR